MAKNFSNRLKNLYAICDSACKNGLYMQVWVKGSETPVQLEEITEAGKIFVRGSVCDAEGNKEKKMIKFVDIQDIMVCAYYGNEMLEEQIFEKEVYL